jgi:hypothetical protein
MCGRASDALAALTGRRPVGFRAPGYTITDGLFDVLAAEGFAYDSSVFPCPAYFAAKTAAIAARKNMVERAGTRVRGDARPTKPHDHKPLAVAAKAAAANAPVDAPVPAPTPFALHMGAVHDMLVSAVGADAIDRQVNKNKKAALSRTSFDFDGL